MISLPAWRQGDLPPGEPAPAPPELRSSLWREGAVVDVGLFFGLLVARVAARPAQLLALFGS